MNHFFFSMRRNYITTCKYSYTYIVRNSADDDAPQAWSFLSMHQQRNQEESDDTLSSPSDGPSCDFTSSSSGSSAIESDGGDLYDASSQRSVGLSLNLRLGPALLQRSQSPPLSYTLTPILPLRLRANISIFQRMAVEFMTRAYRLADCLLIRAFTRVQSTDGFHYLPFTATSLNAPSLTS